MRGNFLIALLAGVYVLMRQLAVIELRETGRALLMGLDLPTHATSKALAYPVWDMFCLSGSLAAIMWVIEGQRVDFWHTGSVDLPVWATPTFSLLALSRTYITEWQRARLRDVLMVLCWLFAGILLSLGLALVIDPYQREKVDCPRGADRRHQSSGHHRVATDLPLHQEAVLWLRRQDENPNQLERVLADGAGTRAQLFLKDRALKISKKMDKRHLVGFHSMTKRRCIFNGFMGCWCWADQTNCRI